MSASESKLFLRGTLVNLQAEYPSESIVEEMLQRFERDKEIIDALTSNNSAEFPLDDGTVKEFNPDYRTPAYEVYADVILGIFTADTNILIGIAVFHHTNRTLDRTGLIRIYISDKCREKGYKSEATMLLLGHIFSTSQIRKVDAVYCGTNDRMRKYLEKCGFTLEVTMKEQVLGENEERLDVNVFAIFKEDLHTKSV